MYMFNTEGKKIKREKAKQSVYVCVCIWVADREQDFIHGDEGGGAEIELRSGSSKVSDVQ